MRGTLQTSEVNGDISPRDCLQCASGRVQYYVARPIFSLGKEEPVAKVDTIETKQFEFAYVGNIERVHSGDMLYTGELVPIPEMGSTTFHAFHRKLESEPGFKDAQLAVNERMEGALIDMQFRQTGTSWDYRVSENRDTACNFNDGWRNTYQWSSTTSSTTAGSMIFAYRDYDRYHPTWTWANERYQQTSNTANTGPQLYRMDVEGWFATGDAVDYRHLSQRGEIPNALMTIFEKIPKKLWRKMNNDEKKLAKAKMVSEKLLKEWLSADEWKALRLQGELQIPSIDEEDVVYIIKKNPNERVTKVKNGKPIEHLCVVAKDFSFPVGDQLLSKLMCLKYNQKYFIQLANKTRVR